MARPLNTLGTSGLAALPSLSHSLDELVRARSIDEVDLEPGFTQRSTASKLRLENSLPQNPSSIDNPLCNYVANLKKPPKSSKKPKFFL
ncbi:hypothetical protein CVT26_011141 [Gymnopilus dilepis]|uniref:Uncharacterized protein n=1 Tax=Gymnopilus dilepis TaxID=231916 RepID=A0A409VYV4_9AGAR|nr:hypothetical protein CVT26_011141 [Gymnopilus dilepis]